MRTVKTQDLTPGMITAEPVLSKHGQLIVAADTELTNQMIAHLSYRIYAKDGTGNPVLFTKDPLFPFFPAV